ncbi:MAG: glycoside hydrolase family 95 protein [Opitutaceae bacterium]|jgi:alpha-L-fucosidase 2|nr:glycoside hydrolase family 95 protein [Opitutaceae bacterium]
MMPFAKNPGETAALSATAARPATAARAAIAARPAAALWPALFLAACAPAAVCAPPGTAADAAPGALADAAPPGAPPADEARFVWLGAPATEFFEATPLGNGRLGATVYGGIAEERVLLNENGMWSGSPQDADRPGAAAALPEIRRLLLAGDNAAAEKLVNAHFTCAGEGSGHGAGANVPFGCYQMLGDLRLRFVADAAPDAPAAATPDAALAAPAAARPVTGYRRELDLARAVCRVTYEQGGVRFTREAFVSAPDEAAVLRLRADRPGRISFDATLSRPERAVTEPAGADGLELHGRLNDGRGGAAGVRYAARVRAVPRGGAVEVAGGVLRVRGADEVLLFVTAATDIRTFAGRNIADARAAADADLRRAQAKPFGALLAAHEADYRRFFDRAHLRLGAADPAAATRDAPERLRRFQEGAPDPSLAALYFNFGRYLLISSSRPGGLPANLQGIWADQIQTPWNGDWHLNINAQMNYWPAEVCNLSELHEPLFALIASLAGPGEKTARTYYGARGWVAFLLANPWGFTSPGELASWGSTVSCSAWLCQHLWDHYLFTGDRAFLARAWPLLRGAALFYLDMLIEEPAHGWLVTAPSNSPENAFLLPGGGKAHVCMGPAADMQLLRHLFEACARASEVLGVDAGLRAELLAKKARLAPTRIGAGGRVMEWLEDYPEADPRHRHVAHLWGLYPGAEITPAATPALAAAARKTLDTRGDGGTGWSLAWKVALRARLGDGARAHRLLAAHLKPAGPDTGKQRWSGGTYANLLDAHPPFQIDGNLGGAAAIAELLLQSHAGEIVLLPALPPEWPEGAVRGLRARGGFEVDIAWRPGAPVAATLRSAGGRAAVVRHGAETLSVNLAPGASRALSFPSKTPPP